jgi:putative mRNA 3-end processing factor
VSAGLTRAGPTSDLVILRREGLYCPAGEFFIDPWRPVPRAVITHAHADHARRGHRHYLASAQGAGVLRARLGGIDLQTLRWGQGLRVNGVRISLHPAGHVLGAAQVRIEHRGAVWVVSGDYFLDGHDESDPHPTCTPFEAQRCHCFITESTFGLPLYRWRRRAELAAEVNAWWAANAAAGRTSLLMGYSFGKAQRLLAMADPSIGPITVHPAVEPLNRAYRAEGITLPATCTLESLDAASRRRALVIAPPGVQDGPWARALGPADQVRTAFASGWMQLRGRRRREGLDRGFAISDHADWPGLVRAIAATGAERVIVTHGAEAVMVRWLREQGLQADSFATAFDSSGDGDGGGDTAGDAAPQADDAHA